VPRPATVEGLTTDGYAAFTEATSRGGRAAKVIALDRSGETTTAEGAAGDKSVLVQVIGEVVFAWTNRGNRTATLAVWSKSTFAVAKGMGIRPGRAAATHDGAFIGYIQNVTAAAADIVVGPTAGAAAVIGSLNAADGDSTASRSTRRTRSSSIRSTTARRRGAPGRSARSGSRRARRRRRSARTCGRRSPSTEAPARRRACSSSRSAAPRAIETGHAYALTTRTLSPGDAPATIARGAERVAVDRDRTTAVYSIPGGGDVAGVWVAPLRQRIALCRALFR